MGRRGTSTVPGAVTSVRPHPLERSIEIGWEPPYDDGGAAIDYYEVRVVETDQRYRVNKQWWVKRIVGLRPGTSYTILIRAHNKKGFGPSVRRLVRTVEAEQS